LSDGGLFCLRLQSLLIDFLLAPGVTHVLPQVIRKRVKWYIQVTLNWPVIDDKEEGDSRAPDDQTLRRIRPVRQQVLAHGLDSRGDDCSIQSSTSHGNSSSPHRRRTRQAAQPAPSAIGSQRWHIFS